jgi:hypothetical protein
MVFVEGESTPAYKHETKESAEAEARRLATKIGKNAYVLESTHIVTPKIDTFTSACNLVGRKHYLVSNAGEIYQRSLIAKIKLITIAEAWNLQDDFVPDFSDGGQWKFFPNFYYNKETGGFVYFRASDNDLRDSGHLNPHICFKTPERAKQFGEQFIDLWNDFLDY